MNLKEALLFRTWSSLLVGEHDQPLFPWMARVDLERLALWLAKHDTSLVWTCDYEDLRKCCAE